MVIAKIIAQRTHGGGTADKGMSCAPSTSPSILGLGEIAPKKGILLLWGFNCGTREGITSFVRSSSTSIPRVASLNLSTQRSTVLFALHHGRCGAEEAMTTWSRRPATSLQDKAERSGSTTRRPLENRCGWVSERIDHDRSGVSDTRPDMNVI